MNRLEYDVMARSEERHWWYVGLRDLLARTLARPDAGIGKRARVLDAGCGTGANLRLLRERLDPGYLGGFDASEAAIELARAKVPAADLYRSDLCDPEIRARELDLVTSLDVLYIPGARRALPGLQRLVEALRPGGLFVLHLPAYDWLRSEHDLAVHTSERYTTRRVRSVLETLDLEIVTLTYRLFWPFPLVAGARLLGKLRAPADGGAARSDLHREPSRLENRLLLPIVRHENRRIAAGATYLWGSSVFAVARRRR